MLDAIKSSDLIYANDWTSMDINEFVCGQPQRSRGAEKRRSAVGQNTPLLATFRPSRLGRLASPNQSQYYYCYLPGG